MSDKTEAEKTATEEPAGAEASRSEEAPLDASVAREPVVVVGVDGSEPALAALRWAARYASAMKLTVRGITAWHFPVDYGYGMTITEDIDLAGSAAKELQEAVVQVQAQYPEVTFEAQVVNDQAGPALVDASRNAELLVVGASGHGELVDILLGSVSTHCVHHAEVPVVVVRAQVLPPDIS